MLFLDTNTVRHYLFSLFLFFIHNIAIRIHLFLDFLMEPPMVKLFQFLHILLLDFSILLFLLECFRELEFELLVSVLMHFHLLAVDWSFCLLYLC